MRRYNNNLYIVHERNWRESEYAKERTIYDDSKPQQQPIMNYSHNEMEKLAYDLGEIVKLMNTI